VSRAHSRFAPVLAIVVLASAALASDPLAPLSDEFSNPRSFGTWSRVHQTEGWNADQMQVIDVDTTVPGHLTMIPWTSGWYNDWRGELTFRTVTGNFVFTIAVEVSDTDGGGLPEAQYSLAGAMIRTPRAITNPSQWTPGGENFVFLSVGAAQPDGPCLPGPGPHLEVKTTVNGNSTLCIEPTAAAAATIQIARIGPAVICLYQSPGGAWQVHRRYARPDMPATLQAGLVTYTDWQKVQTYEPFFQNGHVLNDALDPDPSSNPFLPFAPDMQADFDFARFASVSVPAALAGIDLVTQASDEQLLSFLGEHANPVPPVADLNGDGAVNAADLAVLLGAWGTASADLTGDGVVDAADLGVLLGSWTV
jgi:hypothetical protein